MVKTSAVKVTREGVVTRDGVNIGHVKKEMRQGIFATLAGAGYSGEGTAYWVPFGADGTQLSEYGYDTRKRAVELIEKVSRPTEVSGIEIGTDYFSDRRYVSAGLRWKGYYFSVSRYANEPHWVVDMLCTPESIMPTFSNGSGTRVTAANVLMDDMAQLVTDAAIAVGVWPMEVVK